MIRNPLIILIPIFFASCNRIHEVKAPLSNTGDTVIVIDTTEPSPKELPQTQTGGEEEKYNYQTVPFTFVNDFPFIKDSALFITAVKNNCHLYWDSIQKKPEAINYFKKLKIFGSPKSFFLIEHDFHDGPNSSFPWKEQLLFDEQGKLLDVLYNVWIDTVTILKNEKPFLFAMSRTAHGNGGHTIYKIQADTLAAVYGNDEEAVQTYASGYGMFENIPYELPYRISDDNHDGFNDVIFYGKVRYSTYDLGHDDDKIVPVKFIFLYNRQTGHFRSKEDYRRKYKAIYGEG